MTSLEYQVVLKEQLAVIAKAEATIAKARARVRLPKYRRPARASDIKVGAVIWHSDGDDGWFWNTVEKVLCPDDSFKAYVAEDGCRYGLDGAYVEVQP